MFLSKAIDEVNDHVKLVYGISMSSIPAPRVYEIYKQYFVKSITLFEAAENVHGVLFDNDLING